MFAVENFKCVWNFGRLIENERFNGKDFGPHCCLVREKRTVNGSERGISNLQKGGNAS